MAIVLKAKRVTSAYLQKQLSKQGTALNKVVHNTLALPGIYLLSTYKHYSAYYEKPAAPNLYAVPIHTTAVLMVASRDTEGNAPTYYFAFSTDSDDAVSKEITPKLLEVVQQREKANCAPVRIIFGMTIENKLYCIAEEPLQLSVEAALKVSASLISLGGNQSQILKRLPKIKELSFSTVPGKAYAKGIPISGGVLQAQTKDIFLKEVTTPSDVKAMHAAKAIVTCGGALSHAALLAGSEGLPCIVGISSEVLKKLQTTTALTLNCQTGEIYLGDGATITENESLRAAVGTILDAAADKLTPALYLNADSAFAIAAGIPPASGVGLFRTEHMYQNQQDNLHNYLALIDTEPRKATLYLTNLLSQSFLLFSDAITAIAGAPLTIRLLDAPLKEFNPQADETNPMMGLRGCRFGIIHSEFYTMQVQALALAYKQKGSGPIKIMVPLVTEVGEVAILFDLIRRIWRKVGAPSDYLSLGAMIETPRACLISGELAELCDFLSYGTNDLTQFTFGLSRDDSTYLPAYQDMGAIEGNPFASIDQRGVGRLIWFSAQAARQISPEIKLGLCGNHASDPASIALVKQLGFSYISCTGSKLVQAAAALLSEER